MPTKDSSFRVSFMGTCNVLLSGIHGLRIKEIYIEDFLTKNIPS